MPAAALWRAPLSTCPRRAGTLLYDVCHLDKQLMEVLLRNIQSLPYFFVKNFRFPDQGRKPGLRQTSPRVSRDIAHDLTIPAAHQHIGDSFQQSDCGLRSRAGAVGS